MNTSALTVSPKDNLTRYMQEIQRFPMLSLEEEQTAANRLYHHQDAAAAQTLVTSHLRLVAKIAMGYRGYGLPVTDLVSEGNVGLMQAVKKFNPEKGFRLSTYAMWWIKASIHEYILRSWSLVKIGTTAAQKKLFFNLRKLKGRMKAYDDVGLSDENAESIAKELNVTKKEVFDMNGRMSTGDQSLNAPVRDDTGGSIEWQDWLTDDSPTQEEYFSDADEYGKRKALLVDAMATLKDREKEIFAKRRLADPALTLEELSQEHGISRERVRQIENRAMEKVQTHVSENAGQDLLPA